MRLTREQLTARGLRRKEITIPGTDGTVLIRELSQAEVRDIAARLKTAGDDQDKQLDVSVHVVCLGVVNDDGTPLFGNADDTKSLSLAVLTYLSDQIATFSGTVADEKKVDASS